MTVQTPENEEAKKWKAKCISMGACPACIDGSPDPQGCSDCLNTGWSGGNPYKQLEVVNAKLDEAINLAKYNGSNFSRYHLDAWGDAELKAHLPTVRSELAVLIGLREILNGVTNGFWQTATKWEVTKQAGSITVHSIVIGEVLCRWWGEKEPKGVKLLNLVANVKEPLPENYVLVQASPDEAALKRITEGMGWQGREDVIKQWIECLVREMREDCLAD